MSMRGRILVIQSPMRAKISLTIHHRVSALHIEMTGTSAKLYFYPEYILNKPIQPEQLVFLPIEWAALLRVCVAARYRAGDSGPTRLLRIYPN